MSDFQKLLDQALEKVNLTPVDDTPEMEEYDIDAEVRDLVISARSAANLTQKQLAQRSGVSQANISKIELSAQLVHIKANRGRVGKTVGGQF